MRVEDAERIARAGGEPAVALVLGLLAEIAVLRERVEEHDQDTAWSIFHRPFRRPAEQRTQTRPSHLRDANALSGLLA